jgi:hypothetical protein
MSYQSPQDYPSLPSVSIPAALLGDDLKSFRGGKSTTRLLPAASGSSTAPSSSILFTIPAEPYGMFLFNLFLEYVTQYNVSSNISLIRLHQEQ